MHLLEGVQQQRYRGTVLTHQCMSAANADVCANTQRVRCHRYPPLNASPIGYSASSSHWCRPRIHNRLYYVFRDKSFEIPDYFTLVHPNQDFATVSSR